MAVLVVFHLSLYLLNGCFLYNFTTLCYPPSFFLQSTPKIPSWWHKEHLWSLPLSFAMVMGFTCTYHLKRAWVLAATGIGNVYLVIKTTYHCYYVLTVMVSGYHLWILQGNNIIMDSEWFGYVSGCDELVDVLLGVASGHAVARKGVEKVQGQ